LNFFQGATTKGSISYIEEEQRRKKSRLCFP
jgi:hypothetical protein